MRLVRARTTSSRTCRPIWRWQPHEQPCDFTLKVAVFEGYDGSAYRLNLSNRYSTEVAVRYGAPYWVEGVPYLCWPWLVPCLYGEFVVNRDSPDGKWCSLIVSDGGKRVLGVLVPSRVA